ncbi:MAG: hypothetical protein RRA92_04935 [Gemmatimonadota bacterium]|nr:hypothetical protein [Gemmatimonadota bacterium]
MSTVLAIVAVLAGVGFFWWLDREAAALDETVAPVLAEGEEAEAPEAVDLNTAVLATDPAGSVGQIGWIRFATVTERLGRASFAIRLDSATSLPVLLSPDLIARGTEVYGNDRVTMFGHLFTLNDSIRGEWVNRGAVEPDKAEAIPEIPAFFLADSLSMN